MKTDLNNICLLHHAISGNKAYCDENPAASAIKSVLKVEKFDRFIGAEVPLVCVPGYLPDTKTGVSATCTPFSDEEGKWISSGECLCFEPHSMPYLDFRLVAFFLLVPFISFLLWTFLHSAEHPHYCNSIPFAGIPNAVQPEEGTFNRSITSTTPLICNVGYEPKPEDSKAVCSDGSATEGIWIACGSCESIFCIYLALFHSIISWEQRTLNYNSEILQMAQIFTKSKRKFSTDYKALHVSRKIWACSMMEKLNTTTKNS